MAAILCRSYMDFWASWLRGAELSYMDFWASWLRGAELSYMDF